MTYSPQMNEQIRCLIIDDEKNAHYVLVNYIQRHPDLLLTSQFYNAETAMDFLLHQNVDLVFLDINMPGLSGFEMIAALHNPPKIILTTAYSDYALKAFDYGVLDYLVKPIPYPRFEQAINRFVTNTAQLKTGRVSQDVEFITLKTDSGMIDFPTAEIIYLQSWGNYIKLYTESQTYLCSATTVEVERRLPRDRFVRIHKSYIVAVNKVSSFSGDTVLIAIPPVNLPVGITYRRTLAGIIDPDS
jgi:two-component system LytT family response regulator